MSRFARCVARAGRGFSTAAASQRHTVVRYNGSDPAIGVGRSGGSGAVFLPGGGLPDALATSPAERDGPSGPRSVVFLHGLGDSSEGFVPFFEFLFGNDPSQMDPDGSFANVRVRLPDAPVIPVTVNQGMRMKAWYDVYSIGADRSMDDRIDTEGLEQNRQFITEVLREEAELVGGSHNVLLGGFSQGGVLASFAGLQHDQPLGGIASLRYFIPLHSPPPFFAFHAAHSSDPPKMLT
jgi:predicted esterase